MTHYVLEWTNFFSAMLYRMLAWILNFTNCLVLLEMWIKKTQLQFIATDAAKENKTDISETATLIKQEKQAESAVLGQGSSVVE